MILYGACQNGCAVKKLTIDEIAQLAFVSRSVVSRVLNNRPSVSHEARARVARVIEEHQFTPNAVARSLATHRTYEIGVLAPAKKSKVLSNGFWPLLLRGIAQACEGQGYSVSLSMYPLEDEDRIHQFIRSKQGFEGYILISGELAHVAAPALRRQQLPAVVVSWASDFPELSSVDADNVGGGRLAGEHLARLGHTRIGLLTGPAYTPETRDRLRGCIEVLQTANIPVCESWIVESDYSEQGGYEAMQALLAHPARPTAVFCMSDALATGALFAAHQAGLSVPTDLSVMGYDDLPSTAFTIPPLTTIHQPIEGIGKAAAMLIIQRIEHKEAEPVRRVLPVALRIRASTAPPPV